jgi:hypothetical protein
LKTPALTLLASCLFQLATVLRKGGKVSEAMPKLNRRVPIEPSAYESLGNLQLLEKNFNRGPEKL